MKKRKHELTGEGFSIEEVDELMRDMQPLPPRTVEEEKAYVEDLTQLTHRLLAEGFFQEAEAPPADTQPVPVAEAPVRLPGA